MFNVYENCVKLVRTNLNIQPVRYRGVNVKKPRKPCFTKAVHLAVCQPIYPKPCDFYFPDHLKCRLPINKEKLLEARKELEEYPYQRILAKQLQDEFNNSKMILFFHINTVTGEEVYDMELQLYKESMNIKVHSKHVVRKAIKNTKYEPVLVLFQSHNAVIYSKEVKLNTVFKLLKKMPSIILLAGIVEDKLLSSSQLHALSKLDLQTARAQLVANLNSIQNQLVSNLNLHQQTFVSYLDQYKDILNPNKQMNGDEEQNSVTPDESHEGNEPKGP